MTDKKKEKEKVTAVTMRTPFSENQINALPRRPFFISKEDWKKKKKSRCARCGGWHPDEAIHLDYVGHAAMTDRLLDVDPAWNWEPFAIDQNGLPAFSNGGLWIKLTVLGVTRNGFGDAQGKQGCDATKEVIGDAIRNAAMRFGGALDLWHKGDLHENLIDDEEESVVEKPEKEKKPKGSHKLDQNMRPYISAILSSTSIEEFKSIKDDYKDARKAINDKWPEYMTVCNGEQIKSYADQIKEHHERLLKDLNMAKEQAREFGAKEDDDDFVNTFANG